MLANCMDLGTANHSDDCQISNNVTVEACIVGAS